MYSSVFTLELLALMILCKYVYVFKLIKELLIYLSEFAVVAVDNFLQFNKFWLFLL